MTDRTAIEQALIGAILVNKEAYYRIRDVITRDSFRCPLCAIAFDLAAYLIGIGLPVTPVTIGEHFGTHPAVLRGVKRFTARCAADATTVEAARALAMLLARLAADKFDVLGA